MTRRRFLLLLLVLIVISQIPFVYRRYRLGRLRTTIQQLSSQRTTIDNESKYVDYKGVIHVHTFLGGHSTGTFEELIAASKSNGLDFVIMTEHPQAEFDTSAMTLSGVHSGVLFVNGNEIVTANGDRLLLIPGSPNASTTLSTKDVVEQQKAAGGLAFVAYPTDSQTWASTSIDGVEVYNLFTNTRQINRVVTLFDGLWSYRSYPDLMFANFFTRPTENLKRWDDANAVNDRHLIAIGGNDAHSNVGFGLSDATGKQWLGIKLDPYERSFRTVRTHVLISKDKTLTRETLLEAISLGHCYVSFDIFSDAKGFSFSVNQTDKIMGDRIYAPNDINLWVAAPLASRFVLYKNGIAIEQKTGTSVQFNVLPVGIYRVEVYLDSLPAPVKGQPWIISNPIYVGYVHERPF